MGATGSEGPNASASRIHEVGMSFWRDAGAWFSGMEESMRCKVAMVCKEKGGEAGPSYRKGRGRSSCLELSVASSLIPCLVSALTPVSCSASRPPSPTVPTSMSAFAKCQDWARFWATLELISSPRQKHRLHHRTE